MDIGFIGLGNMGAPMARRLIEAGHKLVVYDTRNDAVAPFVALGAQLASSPAGRRRPGRDRDGEPAVAADFRKGRAR